MKLKNEIAKKYDAPMNGIGWYHDKEKGRLKKTAHALLVSASKMPPARIVECRTALAEHLGIENIDDITDEHLQSIVSIDPVVRTDEFKTHGELVVSRLNTPEMLTEFIHMWRTHFLETMEPKFIHELWEVDRKKSELRNNERRLRTSPESSSSVEMLSENS